MRNSKIYDAWWPMYETSKFARNNDFTWTFYKNSDVSFFLHRQSNNFNVLYDNVISKSERDKSDC